MPDIDCTGPSWRKSASRRRSSCSAVISWSESRACSVSSRSYLLFDPLVLMALGEEQQSAPRGRDRKGEPKQRQPVLLERDADHSDERAGDDQRDERSGSSR